MLVHPLGHLSFFFSCRSCWRIGFLDSFRGVVAAGLTADERLDDVVAELGLDRLRDRVLPEREGDLVERGHRLPARDGQLAARALRGRVGRVLLRERREVGAVLELGVQVVGLLLRLDEDVADVAALGLLVLRLVLVVVGLDLLVADLDVLGDLLEDLLRTRAATLTSPRTCSSVRPCSFSCCSYFFSLAAEVLLLDLLRAARSTSLSVTSMSSSSASCSNCARWTRNCDAPVLERSYSAVPAFGNVPLLRLVAALGLLDQRVELGLRDLSSPTTATASVGTRPASPPPPQPRADQQRATATERE